MSLLGLSVCPDIWWECMCMSGKAGDVLCFCYLSYKGFSSLLLLGFFFKWCSLLSLSRSLSPPSGIICITWLALRASHHRRTFVIHSQERLKGFCTFPQKCWRRQFSYFARLCSYHVFCLSWIELVTQQIYSLLSSAILTWDLGSDQDEEMYCFPNFLVAALFLNPYCFSLHKYL